MTDSLLGRSKPLKIRLKVCGSKHLQDSLQPSCDACEIYDTDTIHEIYQKIACSGKDLISSDLYLTGGSQPLGIFYEGLDDVDPYDVKEPDRKLVASDDSLVSGYLLSDNRYQTLHQVLQQSSFSVIHVYVLSDFKEHMGLFKDLSEVQRYEGIVRKFWIREVDASQRAKIRKCE